MGILLDLVDRAAAGLLVYEAPGSALRSRHAGSGRGALASGRIPGDDVIAMLDVSTRRVPET